jgi:ubiquitin thioesterase OTU1
MSCLFIALGYFMLDSNPDRIRQDICDYLESNPSLYEDGLTLENITELDGLNNEQYISNMRNRNTWGGAIEIKAFCDLYDIDVQVYVVPTCKKILFKSNKKHKNGLIKIYWTGNHYEPDL